MSQPVSIISGIFGDSLIKPIKDHMEICHDTARALIPFFDAVIAENSLLVRELQIQIAALEDRADAIKRHIRLHLPADMLFSVSRNDLLELVRAQDKIANGCRDLAGLVTGRGIELPEALKPELRQCVVESIAAVDALNDTMGNLDSLVGSGFIQYRTRALESGVDAVDAAERVSDASERELRNILFSLEKDMNPVDVMFLYQVIDLIGEVANRAQIVANRLRIIIAD